MTSTALKQSQLDRASLKVVSLPSQSQSVGLTAKTNLYELIRFQAKTPTNKSITRSGDWRTSNQHLSTGHLALTSLMRTTPLWSKIIWAAGRVSWRQTRLRVGALLGWKKRATRWDWRSKTKWKYRLIRETNLLKGNSQLRPKTTDRMHFRLQISHRLRRNLRLLKLSPPSRVRTNLKFRWFAAFTVRYFYWPAPTSRNRALSVTNSSPKSHTW